MSKKIRSKTISLILILSFISLLFITPLNLILIPIKGEEYENIDSFNTNPVTRWDNDLTSSTETLTTDEGILAYNDIGLEGQSSAYSRRLAKSDFKVEGRIKTPIANKTQETEFNSNNLVREYTFEEQDGTVLIDNKNNYNGTLVNTPTYSSDTVNSKKSSYSMLFNSSASEHAYIGTTLDDYVFTNDNDSTEGVDISYSIEFWFKCSFGVLGAGEYYYIYNKEGQTFLARISYLNKLEFAHGDRNFANTIWLKTNSLNNDIFNNTWTHVVYSYDGTNSSAGTSIYLNGVEEIGTDKHDTFLDPPYEGMRASTNQFYLGRTHAGTNYFNGYLDEFRIWKGVELNESDALIRYRNFVVDDTTSQMMIGINNRDITLDLDLPQLCFIIDPIDSNDSSNALVSYGFSSDGIFYSNDFFNISKDIWLRFKIEVDILRSQVDFSFDYDDGTGIDDSEQSLLAITSSIVVPDILSSSVVNIFYGNNFTSNATIEWSLDFIKAPYEEFSFRYFDGDDTTTTIWNPSEFNIRAKVNSSIDNFVSYQNVIPNFDSVSATLNMFVFAPDDAQADIDTLIPKMELRLYNINQSDGSLIPIVGGHLRYTVGLPEIFLQDYFEETVQLPNVLLDYSQKFSAALSFYINPTGTKLMCSFNLDGNVISRSVNVTGLGSEWAVRIIYDFSGNSPDSASFSASVTDLDLVSRDLFGFLPDIGDPLGISGFVKTIMTPLLIGFRAIGSFFSTVMSPIATILGSVVDVLLSLADLIASALDPLFTILEDLLEDVLTAIEGASQILFDIIVAGIGEIIDEAIDWVLTILNDVAEVIGAVIDGAYDFIIEPIVGGMLDWLDRLVDLTITVISHAENLWNGIIEFAPAVVLFVTAYIWFFPGFSADSVGDWISRVSDRLTMNFTSGISVLGFKIPIPLGFVWFISTLFYGVVWF